MEQRRLRCSAITQSMRKQPFRTSVRSVDMRSAEMVIRSDTRRSAREGVALAASALGLGRSRSVIVSDLSPEGALLDGRELPMPGEDLMLIVGSLEIFGKVVWRTGERAGILFEDAIPAETIAQIKKEADWMTAAGWYR